MSEYTARKTTRREVLATALAAAGVAALGGRTVHAAPAEPAVKPALRIGCGTVVFRKLPLKEAMERIRRAGYEYCEPQATGPWCPHVDPWKDDPQAFRDLIQQNGFKGATALWSANGAILDADTIDGITQTLRWAKEAGIPVVNAGDGHKPDSMSDNEALDILRQRLGKILEVAEQCQVYLAIEPHGTFSLHPDGLKKLMALSDSKWLGINYDTANVHRAGEDEVATLKAVVDRVVHVHVKDLDGPTCVALGEGEVDVAGCIRVLRQSGYEGVLSLETEGQQSPEDAQRLIELSRAYLRGVLS